MSMFTHTFVAMCVKEKFGCAERSKQQSEHCDYWWLNEKITDALFNASVFLAGHLLSCLNSA